MAREASGQVLVVAEKERLAQLEAVVERGLTTFVEVGEALMEIRSARLYRETHSTFEVYCRERFGFSDSRGRQLIAAAKTVTTVTELGLPVPKTEWEARRMGREIRGHPSSPPEDHPIPLLQQHPKIQGLLPDITGEEWEAFVESIRKHGNLSPIMLYEGKIVDGWQRYRACVETGVLPAFREWHGDGGDLVEWFVGVNLVRQHRPRVAGKPDHLGRALRFIVQGDEARDAALHEIADARSLAVAAKKERLTQEERLEMNEVLRWADHLEEALNSFPYVEEEVLDA
jgi:hypothetical protein